jgi:ABC-type polysaccharide/polyol phosphate export permease
VRDGYRIMLTAAILLRDHNPLRVFGLLAFVLLLAALVLLALTLAGNLSLLIYSALLALLSASSFGLGLVLNAVNTRFRQLKQIMQRK